MNISYFFCLNATATTQIYTLSLHDALPISVHRLQRHAAGVLAPMGQASGRLCHGRRCRRPGARGIRARKAARGEDLRSEEHTSELQSRRDLVCRLLLEKKKYKRSRAVLLK